MRATSASPRRLERYEQAKSDDGIERYEATGIPGEAWAEYSCNRIDPVLSPLREAPRI